MTKSVYLFFMACMVALPGYGQEPVRVVVTGGYQQRIMSMRVVTNPPEYFPGYLTRAASYIRSHREDIGEDRFILVNCGQPWAYYYEFAPMALTDSLDRILGYDTVPVVMRQGKRFCFIRLGLDPQENNRVIAEHRRNYPAEVYIGLFEDSRTERTTIARTDALDLVVGTFGYREEVFKVINYRRDTVTCVTVASSGRFLAVADFVGPGRFDVKAVEIRDFPADGEFDREILPMGEEIREYFMQPLVHISPGLLDHHGLFRAADLHNFFHRFQLEATGADISFFASPRHNTRIEMGTIDSRMIYELFRYPNELYVVEMTGQEIIDYLEYAYSLRYHTVRDDLQDILRLRRVGEYKYEPSSPVYNWDTACGFNYQVDVTKRPGRRITVRSLAGGNTLDRKKITGWR